MLSLSIENVSEEVKASVNLILLSHDFESQFTQTNQSGVGWRIVSTWTQRGWVDAVASHIDKKLRTC